MLGVFGKAPFGGAFEGSYKGSCEGAGRVGFVGLSGVWLLGGVWGVSGSLCQQSALTISSGTNNRSSMQDGSSKSSRSWRISSSSSDSSGSCGRVAGIWRQRPPPSPPLLRLTLAIKRLVVVVALADDLAPLDSSQH